MNINKDETICECTILPSPAGKEAGITFPDLIAHLNSRGVLYGLDETAIIENVMMAEGNPEKVTFTAARAIPPRNGGDGILSLHVAFPFETRIGNRVLLSGARNPAGQLLLSVNNENLEGVSGTSITGHPIPAQPGSPLRIQSGKNVKILQQGRTANYFSTTDGMAILDDDRLVHVRPVSDGWFNAFFSDDDLKLSLSLYAPSGGGRFVETEEIFKFLETRHVPLGGLKRLEIERLTARHAAEARDIENHLLLQGIPPENGRDSTLEFKVGIEPLQLFSGGDAQAPEKIDFHSVININSVKKDQLIAEKIPATPAIQDGRDIFGRTVTARPGEDRARFHPGKNIVSPDGLRFYSTVNGQIKRSGDLFWVSPVFPVPGDLDFSIGNINFTGDIQIGGNVPDNFQIKTDENILIGRNIAAADIYAGRDLVVYGGIINKKKSRIIVQGDLRARFIEHSGRIEVNGDVYVDDYILQSEVRANGRVILTGSGKGQIIGGEIWAGAGVIARSIGNETEVATRVFAGNFVFIRHALSVVEKEIMEIQTRLKKQPPDKDPAAATRSAYQSEQLQKWRAGLLEQLATGKECFIRVEKEIYPKTEFMLHDRRITFKNLDSFKQFLYSPQQESVITGHFDD